MQQELNREVKFRTSRSSGSGGQHVNKVATKVELIFDVDASNVLDERQKATVQDKLRSRINKTGELQITAQTSRSQALNRKAALRKFEQLIRQALTPPKKRKGPPKLKPDTKKRLKAKRMLSEKKRNRKKVIRDKVNDLSSS